MTNSPGRSGSRRVVPRPLPAAPFILVLIVVMAVMALVACSGSGSKTKLTILSGSENRAIEPLVKSLAAKDDIDVTFQYQGSVDIMLELQGTPSADAVWPANSLWITLGDKAKRVKHSESMFRSPVAFGVKRSVAGKLGWVGHDVSVAEILKALESSSVRLMMTSATQSNSGASAYLGFLYAFSGNPPLLTAANLHDPDVQAKVKRILNTIDRSSESSGFLEDLFLSRYDQFDAMVNYESIIIETNQKLEKDKREPLYVVYPSDGLTIADSPLAFVDQGDPKKEQAFLKLQQRLLTPDAQAELLKLGRRTASVGVAVDKADPAVFNAQWGIDPQKAFAAIRLPQADVLVEALDLYQTTLRKGSFTVYCLDYSPSMAGKGTNQLQAAMRTLLQQNEIARYLLQAAPQDITAVIPFDSGILSRSNDNGWIVSGDAQSALDGLERRIEGQALGSGTNIYGCPAEALRLMKRVGIGDRFPSIILMTDGQSNAGSLSDLKSAINQTGLKDVPVFAITFGDASTKQLKEITDLTGGQIYDGTTDLITGFRKARGNN